MPPPLPLFFLARSTDDTTSWVANPLTTSTTTGTWSDSVFFVPATTGPVGYYKEGTSSIALGPNMTSADIITTGFTFYGAAAMVQIDGALETLWYAVATATDGLWSVGWNAAHVEGAEMLTLKRVTAPNVDYPPIPSRPRGM